MSVSTRFRVPAGLPTGGQFAPKACRAAYEALDALAALAGVGGGAAESTADGQGLLGEPDPANPARILLPVERCPHGHFARWAARNCCAVSPLPAAGGQAALPCTGIRRDRTPCTRRTTHRLAGRPACHDHGGRPAATA